MISNPRNLTHFAGKTSVTINRRLFTFKQEIYFGRKVLFYLQNMNTSEVILGSVDSLDTWNRLY